MKIPRLRMLLKENLPALFPTDHPRSPNMNFKGKKLELPLPKECIKNLADIARENNTTYFIILISIYCVLIYGYAGQILSENDVERLLVLYHPGEYCASYNHIMLFLVQQPFAGA